jgi:hypothetical protein
MRRWLELLGSIARRTAVQIRNDFYLAACPCGFWASPSALCGPVVAAVGRRMTFRG